MHEINGICYAGTPEASNQGIRILNAIPLRDGMLLATFSTGEKKLFDTTTLTGSAFEPLRDEEVFQAATVQHGFVSWLNGAIDIAPEYMYEHGWPYDQFDIMQATLRPNL